MAPPSETWPRAVLLIGSSGGGAATLGRLAAPDELRAALDDQLARVGGGAVVAAAAFVSCSQPLDSALPDAPAALWELGHGGLQCLCRGPLAEVNQRARVMDRALARRAAAGEFDGVVAVSSDAAAGGVNREVLEAAGHAALPVTGTGGTSLSIAAGELGCVLVGNAGGSVATTVHSKAIGAAAAMAGAWQVPYSPACCGGADAWHSALDGCLPVFLSAACTATAAGKLRRRLEGRPGAAGRLAAFLVGAEAALRGSFVPPAVGAVVAQQASGLAELAVLGGAGAGALAGGSAFAALLAGRGVGAAAPLVLAACARGGVPATASGVAAAGGLAASAGLIARAASPGVDWLADLARTVLDGLLGGRAGRGGMAAAAAAAAGGLGGRAAAAGARALAATPLCLAGAAAGLLMNWGARRGWYHQVFLPLILLEMEHGQMSLLGSLDWLALCMAGAGACAAQLAAPRPGQGRGAAALARRGLWFNLAYGDYVEACYPFLDQDRALDAAVYASSAGAGAVAAAAGARSAAYLPAPAAAALGSAPGALTAAAAVAFGVPFAAGVASNVFARRWHADSNAE